MARYYESQWPAYVSIGERRAKAEREARKLSKKGAALSPVVVEGRKITTTFWGKSWCDNLESYRDYENRLDRGRSYVRNGLVIDLQIAPHLVTAIVSGSSIYTIKITIAEVRKAQWESICADCAGGIDSLVELLQGRFSKGVMERICRQGTGLFPKPSDIRFSCSCPDHASMCKHVAAALYGVGARLDARPELLFRLRAVDENDLVANIGDALPLSKQAPGTGKVLEADDMAALFGLDMGDVGEQAVAADVPSAKTSPAAVKEPAPVVKLVANKAKRTVAVAPTLAQAKAVAPKVTRSSIVAPDLTQPGAAPRKGTRTDTPPTGKSAEKPVAWWKPSAAKSVGKAVVEAGRPSAGRKLRSA